MEYIKALLSIPLLWLAIRQEKEKLEIETKKLNNLLEHLESIGYNMVCPTSCHQRRRVKKLKVMLRYYKFCLFYRLKYVRGK